MGKRRTRSGSIAGLYYGYEFADNVTSPTFELLGKFVPLACRDPSSTPYRTFRVLLPRDAINDTRVTFIPGGSVVPQKIVIDTPKWEITVELDGPLDTATIREK